jgi:cell fate regulator YaaT (PSP1 superfamily)
MSVVYEVVRKRTGRSVFWTDEDAALTVGDEVVLEAEGREELGRVVWKGVEADDLGGDAFPDVAGMRKATPEDMVVFEAMREKEAEALQVFRRKIGEHGLPMEPVDVEYETDRSRITFYFTAAHRVDFRALVRDLARVYHTRIELRQIGPRQEAQRIGGCGACGRLLCCASFMKKTPTVSAHTVRDQFLSQNPSKLVGVCGQLKCCLRFELDFYREAKARFPEIGAQVRANHGSARVEKRNIYEDTVQVRHKDGLVEDLPLGSLEVEREGGRKPESQRPSPADEEGEPGRRGDSPGT